MLRRVSNVLNEEKKHQVIALGRLGWSLRRIEREIGVRRETAAGYLKTAGIGVRFPGAWGRRPAAGSEAKPANGVTTGSDGAKPANGVIPDLDPDSNPANGVIPDSGTSAPKQTVAASASEPYRELIEQAAARGRNAKAI